MLRTFIDEIRNMTRGHGAVLSARFRVVTWALCFWKETDPFSPRLANWLNYNRLSGGRREVWPSSSEITSAMLYR